jgi:glutamyl-tRNA synthetase
MDRLEYESKVLCGKLEKEQATHAVSTALAKLEQIRPWKAEAMEEMMRAQAVELGLKPGPFFGLFRVAVTGRTVSPPLFETMEVLGKERSLTRIRTALRS